MSVSELLRTQVQRRAGGRCEYCHYPDAACYAAFHVDHCMPKSHGGRSTFQNLAWACPTCNGSRQDRLAAREPRSGLEVPLFNPRLDNWDGHFAWSGDGLRLVGRTATGRATILVLRMNRPSAIRIRALLLRLGFVLQ